MTEDEAKQRWCPFARVVVAVGRWVNAQKPLASGNRLSASVVPDGASREDMTNPGASRCIASACMAWRWSSDFNEIVARHPEAKTPAEIKSYADGFCGLAGKPE